MNATLGGLRAVFEQAINNKINAGDSNLLLIEGLPLLNEEHLVDGVHPNDEGHRLIAAAAKPLAYLKAINVLY